MFGKYITIGRHEYTPIQIQLLEAVGLFEEIDRVEYLKADDINRVVKEAVENNASIVVQALPVGILAKLLKKAREDEVPVYGFIVETIGTFGKDEALTLKKHVDADVWIESNGSVRLGKTKALTRLRKVVVEQDIVKEVVPEYPTWQ